MKFTYRCSFVYCGAVLDVEGMSLASVEHTEEALCVLKRMIQNVQSIARLESQLVMSATSVLDKAGDHRSHHVNRMTGCTEIAGPGPTQARRPSQRASTRRLPRQSPFHVELCTPSSGNSRLTASPQTTKTLCTASTNSFYHHSGLKHLRKIHRRAEKISRRRRRRVHLEHQILS